MLWYLALACVAAPWAVGNAIGLPYLYTTRGQNRLDYSGMNHAHLAPLTEWAQRYIWEAQHPHDCSKAKLVMNPYHILGGMGSQMHVGTWVLHYALDKGYVMTWGEGDCGPYADIETCGQSPNCECFFQPLTNCSREDVARKHVRKSSKYYQDKHFMTVQRENPAPRVFAEKLREHYSFTNEEIRYWWRAQAVGYLMRLNEKTLNAVLDIRMNQSNYESFAFPLPSGSIHAHIRAGDKFDEMRLVQSKTFLEAAVRLSVDNPFSYTKFMYVASDSSDRLRDCLLSKPNGWSIGHAHMYRKPEGQVNVEILTQGYAEGHVGQLALRHLAELMLALEADAWVGTRGSNWNRLIDELRCVVVDKCHGVFKEVGDTPPGVYPW
jgi:hypothetical protein